MSKQRRSLSILAAFLLCGSLQWNSSAQDSRQPPPKLKPVPMNPGPLGPAGYVLLVPIDDRPAVGQFAQMIGEIADHRVTMPPREMLGRFTTPGDPARIDQWLRAQDYSKLDALIVSVDMLAYGGLIASRVHNVPFETAQKRLDFFRWFKARYPLIPVYTFSTIMRVAEISPKVTEDYLDARKRNLQLNLAMLELVKTGVVNELILLQDDAREFGLHRQDQSALKARLKELGLESRVPIYNGADEGSLSLVSRAILDKFLSKVRVSVIYSSEKAKSVIAPYEDHPLQFTVEGQIRAAGGVPVGEYDQADYRLFVNAPATSEAEFDWFLQKMIKELKEVRHVALADLLFPKPHHSGADERIIAALKREGLLDAPVGYAAWNTAGNTLGTAIPHANLRVFFRTKLNDRADRAARAQAAHLDFLFNRYAGDYLYHDIVRLQINERLRREARDGTVTSQLTPEKYDQVNREVTEQLRAQIEKFFAENFQNRTYTLAIYRGVKRTITVKGLKNLKIYLPWPRTFEVVIENRFEYTEN